MVVRFEDFAWLARVSSKNRSVKGAALAIDGKHLVTCVHVVQDAGPSRPGEYVRVDFPVLGKGCEAVVLEECWAPAGDGGMAGDLALLQLAEPPVGLEALPLRSLRSLDGLDFTAYGFLCGFESTGISTHGTLGKAVGLERVQLEVRSAQLVQPGFSGAPVWSDKLGAVVGMLTSRHRETEGRVAFAVPMRTIAAHSPIVTAALQTPLDLDRDRATHWGPRSRGVSRDRDDAGWLFSGRRQALCELVQWLTAQDGASMRVVTGMPGSGKSAVLARLVTSADPHYRRRIPGLWSDPPTVPPEAAFDVTFHAKGRTVREFVDHVAALAEVAADDASTLSSALDEQDGRLVLAVDAVDEATEPRELCGLLNDLAELGSRILVGCREPLTDQLADQSPLRLDQAPYLQEADVELYVRRLLADRVSGTQPDTEAFARDIAAAAHGNFLVAQLTAHAAALGGPLAAPFPRTVARAFDRLLDALPDPEGTRELLLPLAYSFGDGLPDELWLSAVRALSRPCEPADLDRLLDGPAAAFLITRRNAVGGDRHGLFHEALAETLTARRNVTADQRRLWRAWTERLPRSIDGGVRWGAASPYLLEYAAEHAAQADALGELAADVGYLLSGQLARMLVQLAKSPALANSKVAVILRLTATRAQPLDPEHRAGLLALAAHHLGLPALAVRLLEEGRPSARPRWAHTLGPPQQVLTGHTGPVYAVACGRLGERDIIASASLDRTVRVWDAVSGEPIGDPLTGHTDGVLAVACGRVGERDIIVSASLDGTARVWDAASGERIGDRLTGHSGPVMAVACGRAGERVIIASAGRDGTVRRWDAASGEPIGNRLTDYYIRAVPAVAIGRAGERDIIASASDDGTVRRWDAASGERIGDPLTGHSGPVDAVAIGRAGERDIIASAGDDGTVRRWDAVSGEPIGDPLTGHSGPVDAVAIGRAGERDIIASAGYDRTVRRWDAAGGERIGDPLTGHSGPVDAVACGRAGERDIIASASNDRTVRVWDAAGGERIGDPLTGHSGPVDAVACGRAGERDIIASASNDRTVRLWDAVSGQPIGDPIRQSSAHRVLTGHTDGVTAVAIGRAGARHVIATAGYDRTVRVWDAVSGEPIGGPLTGHAAWVTAVAVGRVGERDIIASASRDRTVRVWDAASGEPIGDPLRGHTEMVSAVAIGRAGEGDIIASAGVDRAVWRWDALSGEPIRKPLTGHTGTVTAVAIGRAGERDIIASAGVDRAVWRWDALSGEPIGKPLTGPTGTVTAVAIGRAGERDIIASASWDRTVRVWDPHSGAAVEVIHALDPVSSLALAGDGRLYIATGIAVCCVEVSVNSTNAFR